MNQKEVLAFVERHGIASDSFLDAQIGIDVQRHFCRNRRMMKTRIAVMALAVSFMAAGACFAANPHLGTWKLNEAKSKLAPGMGKSTMVTYAEQKDKIKVTVDGIDKDGKATHGVWVGKFDGKAYPAKGNMSWNSAAYKEENERTNDITTWKDGKMVWSGRISVAANGKSRTVTTNGTDEKGKKLSSKAVYDKE
jgi:lipopolysaccharide export LptBFGC system permease protein LptF